MTALSDDASSATPWAPLDPGRGVARGAAIADYEVVLTGGLDQDSVTGAVAATDAAFGSRPAGVYACWDSGHSRFCGAVPYLECDGVAS